MKEYGVEARLDQILEVLYDLKLRVGSLEKALADTQSQVEEMDDMLSKRWEVIKQNLTSKTENAEFVDLKHQFEILQQEKAADRKLINSQQSEITRLTGQVEGYLQIVKREQLSIKAYSKRFSLLVHGIDEDENNAWETSSTTETKLKNFLIEGLKIENIDNLQIFDLHSSLNTHYTATMPKWIHLLFSNLLATMTNNWLLTVWNILRFTMKTG